VSCYDDELWRLVPEDPGPPPGHLRRFVEALPPVGRALDLGCGDGRLTALLPAERVSGADVSGVALDRAARRLPGAELVQLEPDEALPFEDSSFELVLCAETLEHVRDVQLLLSEVRRVLRPGGLLAVTTPAHGRVTGLEILVSGIERRFDPFSPHIRFFSARSLRGALDDLGFRVARLRREAGTLLAVASRP
jgi:SAM-dependent methyltransferase